MEYHTIRLNGHDYKVAYADNKKTNDKVLIGETELGEVLNFSNNKRLEVDKQFYGYVDSEVFDLPKAEFDEYVEKNC